MDNDERELFTESLRKVMLGHNGTDLDKALDDLGWAELLAEFPDVAIPLTFSLLGETGAHSSVLNDVLARSADVPAGSVIPLPFTGGRWLEWSRDEVTGSDSIDPELPLREVSTRYEGPLGPARVALGWWLVGSSRAMLDLARAHALDRTQFGRPIAAFQAVRHRLAETFVAVEGAEATLTAVSLAATDDTVELSALLAKAAAGRAALITSRHVQQVLGGIGFTAEHVFHNHARRVLMLDALLGSSRELTAQAGAAVRVTGSAPRLTDL